MEMVHRPKDNESRNREADNGLWDLPVEEFMDQMSLSRPSITGGSAVMTCSGFALSIVVMSLEVSVRRSRKPGVKTLLTGKISDLREIRACMREAADRDQEVFNEFRERKVKSDAVDPEVEKKERLTAAIDSPLDFCRLLIRAVNTILDCPSACHLQVLSDLISGLLILGSCLQGMLLLLEANIRTLPAGERRNFRDLQEQVRREAEVVKAGISALTGSSVSRLKT